VSPALQSGTLFDTSSVIGLAERQSLVLVDVVKALGQPLTRSITVYGELRHGAAVADRPGQPDRQRTLARYEQLSEWSEFEVSLDAVGQAYGDDTAIATENGVALGMNDRWIIAECVTQRARLVTGDRRQARLAELVAEHLGDAFEVLVVD
jgi:predicted nucleic acid-binding protein